METSRFRILCALAAAMMLSGCAGAVHWSRAEPDARAAQPVAAPKGVGDRVVQTAATLVGAPYRYGGASPQGFDCSGLVHFSYRRAGVRVPRTTRDLYRRAQPIAMASLKPGDLLFFYFDNKIGHVAIYSGDNQFIHAPSSGKYVARGSLDDQFWRERLVSAGRLLL